MASIKTTLAVLVPLLAYTLYSLFAQPLIVLGVFRTPRQTAIDDSEDLVVISGTVNCEDLHYHEPSHSIFTACDDVSATRRAWFPPLGILDDPVVASKAQGSLRVIDTKTMKSRRLKLVGFEGPFVTHGIDVIPAPNSDDGQAAVYILAVNHVPHVEYIKAKSHGNEIGPEVQRTDPRIETFYHVLGSDAASHVRTTKHPLIKTPNDISAVSDKSFYVTNDHYYADGLLRTVEDLYPRARWSTTVRVRIPDTPTEAKGADTASCEATVVLSELHNNNGLGHVPDPNFVIIGSAASGAVHIARLPDEADKGSIKVLQTLQLNSTIDNPSYFADPYADATFDASGIVNAGLTTAIHLAGSVRDPEGRQGVMIWHSRRVVARNKDKKSTGAVGEYETRLIFEDDGRRISTASAAVLVAIDPKLEGGRRKAWLYMSGFQSSSAIAVKIDL